MYISTYLDNYVSDTRAIRFAIPVDSVTLMALGHLWHVSRNWKRNVRDPYRFCSCNRVKDDVLPSVSWCLKFCNGLLIIIISAKFHVTSDFHGFQSLILILCFTLSLHSYFTKIYHFYGSKTSSQYFLPFCNKYIKIKLFLLCDFHIWDFYLHVARGVKPHVSHSTLWRKIDLTAESGVRSNSKRKV